jgi:hypothetical protein
MGGGPNVTTVILRGFGGIVHPQGVVLMTLAPFLVATLVFCSVSAVAQKQTASIASPTQAADANQSAEITNAEPWRLIPNRTADAGAEDPLARLRIGDYRAFQFKADGRGRISNPDSDSVVFLPTFPGRRYPDTTCFAIRSYVVARDEKDSDSTHPVRSSTCQPASRYKLKSAERRVTPSNQ